MRTYTPLRYPGGKGQVYNFVVDLLEKNNLIGCSYIEPYAGGAGVAIRLLLENKVKKIVINDYDRSIYAFWFSILNCKDEFVDRLRNCPLTIEEWKRQKEIQKNKDTVGLLDLGFSTFFLNRTNRSGIIKAGVIGGLKQNGNYKMDCRFNKEKLIKLIELIYVHRKRIEVFNLDAIEFIKRIKRRRNQFYFIDPPYYEKGQDLYVNFFRHQDHEKLAKFIIKSMRKKHYILTYDLVEQIKEMYSTLPQNDLCLTYSAETKRKATEILISNPNLFL